MSTRKNSREMVAQIVERALPNTKRPQLEATVEAKLQETDQQSAKIYADGELACRYASELVRDLDNAGEIVANSIPVYIEEEDSLVYHLEKARAVTEAKEEISTPPVPATK